MVEQCTQCGGAIGEVGTPHVWKDRVVCAACHSRLRAGRAQIHPTPHSSPPSPAAGVTARTAFYAGATGRHIQCVVVGCGYRGPGVESREYSRPLAFVLLCLGILPGVIYLLLHNTTHIRCPRCGASVLPDQPIENSTQPAQ